MNTKLVVSFWLLAVAVSGLRAQAPHSDSSVFSKTLAAPFAVIHVDLSGDVVLHAWDQPRAEVRVIDEVSGRVIGFGNGASRAPYAVDFTPTDGGLVIAARGRATSFVIGYSTIQEHLRHDVYLPATARICVDDTRNDVTVDGRFLALDIAGSGPHALKLRDGASTTGPLADCGSNGDQRR